jgi:NADPH:quinone reductase-like Zn-dependent oxidoreductase
MDPRPGATLLVHGAGSMVGYAAVQIALRRGVRVIATAGPTFAGELAAFGAEVTAYGPGMADRVRALAGGDVDLVLDTPRPMVGVLPELIALAGGDPKRVVTVSNHDEARRLGARVNLDELIPSGALARRGFLAESAALAAAGGLRIPIAKAYPLDAWRDAVELLASGTPHGKVVLLPGSAG